MQVYFEGTFSSNRNGAMIEFMGTEGTLYIDRGRYEVIPDRDKKKPEPSSLILGTDQRRGLDFYDKPDGELLHLTNWVECVRDRRRSRPAPPKPASAPPAPPTWRTSRCAAGRSRCGRGDAMKRPRKITLGCLGRTGLATVLALVPFQVLVWDGGFPSIECRLRFVESNGNPVPGVKLTVHNKAGGVSHFYPVDEFVPESPVTSDDEGWMVFHHVSRGFEFGGKDYRSVFGFTLSEAKSPYYECVFSLVDREVFRTHSTSTTASGTNFRSHE